MSSVLFVCLGNICRSPMAEGLARQRWAERLPGVQVDSAGTGDWHRGQPPDARAVAVAAAHGVDLSALRARQCTVADAQRFDLILCADRDNLDAVRRLLGPRAEGRCDLLLRYAGIAGAHDVPDPYYGDLSAFEQVFALLRDAIDAIGQRLQPR
jgi:protein-tyrosine phosphatase